MLAALKAFSMWSLGPLVGKYLSGTCASGVHEARLGREHYGGEVHTYSAAYSEADLREVLKLSDHVVFNSPAQWKRFRSLCESVHRQPEIRPSRQPGALGRRSGALRSLRAVLAPRHAARGDPARATSTA